MRPLSSPVFFGGLPCGCLHRVRPDVLRRFAPRHHHQVPPSRARVFASPAVLRRLPAEQVSQVRL